MSTNNVEMQSVWLQMKSLERWCHVVSCWLWLWKSWSIIQQANITLEDASSWLNALNPIWSPFQSYLMYPGLYRYFNQWCMYVAVWLLSVKESEFCSHYATLGKCGPDQVAFHHSCARGLQCRSVQIPFALPSPISATGAYDLLVQPTGSEIIGNGALSCKTWTV